MKAGISILVLLFSLTQTIAVGQISGKDSYVYKFQVQNPVDTLVIRLDVLKTHDNPEVKVEGEIKNPRTNASGFFTLILKNGDTTISKTTNAKGQFDVMAKPGNCELTVIGIGYQKLTRQIFLSKDESSNYEIPLLSQNSVQWYTIHSKITLNPQQIDNLKKCVMVYGKIDKCTKRKKYYITIEI